MAVTVLPFLMFQGQAWNAIEFYLRVIPGTRIIDLTRHGPTGPNIEGQIQRSLVEVGGSRVIFYDSPPIHTFGFTPAFSFCVECHDEGEFRAIAAALREGGEALMDIGDYDFPGLRLFTWINDRFGVSWQCALK